MTAASTSRRDARSITSRIDATCRRATVGRVGSLVWRSRSLVTASTGRIRRKIEAVESDRPVIATTIERGGLAHDVAVATVANPAPSAARRTTRRVKTGFGTVDGIGQRPDTFRATATTLSTSAVKAFANTGSSTIRRFSSLSVDALSEKLKDPNAVVVLSITNTLWCIT